MGTFQPAIITKGRRISVKSFIMSSFKTADETKNMDKESEVKTSSEASVVPRVKADEEEEEEEELVDPADAIKEKCAEDHCVAIKERLDTCNERVSGRSNTEETCFEEILDFYHCVDHCAGPKIFSKLKQKPFQNKKLTLQCSKK